MSPAGRAHARPLRGLGEELAGFEGRRDLNGARVRLVSQSSASVRSSGLRWRVVVIDVTPPEVISVKPETLVAAGSQPVAVYELRPPSALHSDEASIAMACAEHALSELRSAGCKRRRVESQLAAAAAAAAAATAAAASAAAARLGPIQAAAASAGARERTAELTLDSATGVCFLLGTADLGRLLRVCKAWGAAACMTVRDPAWQVRTLCAQDLTRKGNPFAVSHGTRRLWMQAQPQEAAKLDVRTLVSLGAPRSVLLLRLDNSWLAEKTQFKSCQQINYDVQHHGLSTMVDRAMPAVHAQQIVRQIADDLNAALAFVEEMLSAPGGGPLGNDLKLVATLEYAAHSYSSVTTSLRSDQVLLLPSDGSHSGMQVHSRMRISIGGRTFGHLPVACGAAAGEGRLMRHPMYNTWPESMRRAHPFVIRTATRAANDQPGVPA